MQGIFQLVMPAFTLLHYDWIIVQSLITDRKKVTPPLMNMEYMYDTQVKRQENTLSPIVPIDPKETLLYATQ